MKLPRRRFLQLATGVAALPAASRIARAQIYPTRPITMIVPFPPAGPTDAVARIMAEPMRVLLGQPVIVENLTGAGGSLGAGRVARAVPDGYTLSVGNWNSHVANGAIYPLQYDVVTDFEPVALLTGAPLWLVAKKTMPAANLQELVAWLKANPDKASAGTAGIGTAAHLCGLYFQDRTGTRFQFVPYRGGAPAYQDLIAGQIDLMCADTSATAPQVRSGNMRAYAVMSKTRWSGAPDTPTVDEVGLPGLYVSFWQGLWAPKGTPKDIIARLNTAVMKAFSDPIIRQRLVELGQEIPQLDQQTPEALRAFQKAEIEKWWPIIKAANIKGE
jgi:tripartite-type tricarboxylate transporter receptor subunit TctC